MYLAASSSRDFFKASSRRCRSSRSYETGTLRRRASTLVRMTSLGVLSARASSSDWRIDMLVILVGSLSPSRLIESHSSRQQGQDTNVASGSKSMIISLAQCMHRHGDLHKHPTSPAFNPMLRSSMQLLHRKVSLGIDFGL